MMKFKLAWPLGPHGEADSSDVHAIKVALNQLGYYTPPPMTGIEEMREPALFDALNKFQRDNDIPSTTYIMPYSPTVYALDKELKAQDPTERYVWRTVQDNRVRDSHAAREGQVFLRSQPPEGGNPGEDFNCRCWEEAVEAPATKKNNCEEEEIAWINAQGKLKVAEDALKEASIEKELLQKELESLTQQLKKETSVISGDKGKARDIGGVIGLIGGSIVAGLPGAAPGLSAGANIGVLIEEAGDFASGQKTDLQLKVEIQTKKDTIKTLEEKITAILQPAIIAATAFVNKTEKIYFECLKAHKR